ncbi:glycosyltransferase family 4 protein [Pseudoduganella namucuonensis]|uniref:glycosyltransferase family 4 protein n=1 Tax=Pseudoduganella namucuonensis TaxID=1035707 RepID=UPI0015A6BCDB|nr:glycosyltransferase family 4 protein [Pseudoduganella namucuonensis]
MYLSREPHPSFRPDIATLFGGCLPRHGVHSDLVALQEGEAGAWPAGRAHTRQGRGRLGRLWARWAVALDLFRLSRDPGYDAIQVRDRILGALIGLLAARRRGLPFFYWMSLPFPDAWQDLGRGDAANSASWPQRARWKLRGALASLILYRVVLPRADHIFVQSEAMRALLAGKGLPAEKMTPVPMGVALPERLDAVAPADDPRLAGRKVLVYLGALERLRHPEVMIEAMVEIARREPLALLVMVGDSQHPGERAWLEGEIERLGLRGHALITGWMAPAEAWRYLRAAHIGLSPFPRSRILEVASPTKVCEYLAYGVPVVANDQPDQAALIEQTGGGLCVPLTPAGFASGVLELLADPARAGEMARLGRARIGQLRSYDVLAARLAEQYRRLLAPGGGLAAKSAATAVAARAGAGGPP